MPLLGRHKSFSGPLSAQQRPQQQAQQTPSQAGPDGSGQQQQQRQLAAVCESPLFGIRRQLPMVLVAGNQAQRQPETSRNEQPMAESPASGSNGLARQPLAENRQHWSRRPVVGQSELVNGPVCMSSTSSSVSASKSTALPASGAAARPVAVSAAAGKEHRVAASQQQLETRSQSGQGNCDETQTDEHTLGTIPKQITRQQIHYAFSIMDTNSDGLIDVRDLSHMLANLGIPIDESILAHVLAGASKREDQRMSESEFLHWMGHFVQVNENAPERRAPLRLGRAASGGAGWPAGLASGGRWRKGRPSGEASGAANSLVASVGDSVAAESLRKRRGSGSGLALMRSLSSGANKEQQQQQRAEVEASPAGGPQREQSGEQQQRQRKGAQPAALDEQQAASDEQEARNDLRAAFCVFDLDGDGFITLDEVRAGLKLLGETWSAAELNQLFNRCATTGPQQQCAPASGPQQCTLRANDLRQRISIDDFVRLLL